MQTEVKEEKEKEKERTKVDCYMPISNPTANKAYQLIKWYETEILQLIVFTIPDLNLRSYMDQIRGKLKDIACSQCEHLDQMTQSKAMIQVFEKSEGLSEKLGMTVLIQNERESKKKSMACLGCRALRDKQLATGYIKGRRFKQV